MYSIAGAVFGRKQSTAAKVKNLGMISPIIKINHG